MTELALYRKWRSRNFDELVGQTHITQTLSNAIKSGKTAHAYLFCGPRGTGKTSTAKILAKALNCDKGPTAAPCNQCATCLGIQNGTILDCIEIDAASNRGIDEMRDLREKVKFPPSMCRYKVYIIDEVHMLTPEAFNALLKTLEEPPPHTIFVLCTTEPHKLLSTVASRCQRFDFRRINSSLIRKRLEEIAVSEGLRAETEIFSMITQAAEGSLRDAISLLDQLRTFCQDDLTKEKALLLLGQTPREMLRKLMGLLAERNLKQLLISFHQFLEQGADLTQLVRDLMNEFRNVLLSKIVPNRATDGSEEEKELLKAMAPRFQSEELYRILRCFSDLVNDLRYSQHQEFSVEIALMRMVHAEWEPTVEGLKRRIDLLEEKNSRLVPQPSSERKEPIPGKELVKPPLESKPTAAPVSLTLSDLQDRWPDLVEKLKAAHHRLFPALLDARPVKLNGKTLTLAFPNSILKNSFESKREEAQAILKENFLVEFNVVGEVQAVDSDAFVREAEILFEGAMTVGDANA